MIDEIPIKEPKKRGRPPKIEKLDYKKNGKNIEFIPSQRQIAVFDHIQYGVGNLVVNSVAGSGKTTTIVNAIKLIPENQRVLFIAFNVAIVKELKKRIGKAPNIDIMTCHSLGLKMIKQNFKNIVYGAPDIYKYRTYIKRNINNLTTNNINVLGRIKYNTYINNICSLVDYARYNLAQSSYEINLLAKRYGIILFDDECDIVVKVLKWGANNIEAIDFTDMVWLPNELSLNPYNNQYDWVFVDECQDLSEMQQKLFLKCFKRGTRFCAIGDNSQCINSWAGASPDAFKNLQNLPNTKTLPLPISYRCPKSVVRKAQKYVPHMEYRDDAPEGEIIYNAKIGDPQSGDMVLCRTTAPLIRLHMSYLRLNKKSYIRGKDIGKNLIKLIKDTKEELLNRSLIVDGVFVRLYEQLFILRNNLMVKSGLDLEDATLSPQIIDLYDSIKAIEVLSEGLRTAEELIEKINTIFLDSDGEGVCLSTIHKAKGSEADNVYIICESLMPSRLAVQDWEKEAEENLIYVAITRAKQRLIYISEDDFPPQTGYFNPDSTLKDLMEIENKISKTLNQPLTQIVLTTTKENIKIIDNIEQPNKQKTKTPGAIKFNKFL